METASYPFSTNIFKAGLFFLALSLVFFTVPFWSTNNPGDDFNQFLINFILTAVYFVALLGHGVLRRGRQGLYPLIVFLMLLLVSAFGLNRLMNIFETTTLWFGITLVGVCGGYLAFAFFEKLSSWVKLSACFITGIGLIAFLYLAIYLIPLYILSALASVLLGISMHSFVPLLFCIYTLVIYKRVISKERKMVLFFWLGVATAIFVICIFLATWLSATNSINKVYENSAPGKKDFPAWIEVASRLPKNTVTEKLLKSNLVYTTSKTGTNSWFWNIPSQNFEEQKKHDPLVMIASFFSSDLKPSEEDRISILKAIYDSRHHAQERLWSGEDLFTTAIRTNVKIWQSLRMSYTEKKIKVTNKSIHRGDNQEAIYTMHMPEGSVVTSLSLWINGKEEKGILTTKAKAQNAYKTIVGVQNRDPSEVHWQEGNTVSIRVFPVLPHESRVFKIGITSPLAMDEHRLRYEDVYFDGPDVSAAGEDITIEFDNKPVAFYSSLTLDSKDPLTYARKGRYAAGWNVEFASVAIKPNQFSFAGNKYSIVEGDNRKQNFVPASIYLDINSSWSAADFSDLWAVVNKYKVFGYVNGLMQEINDANSREVFDAMVQQEFSLFPFHLVASNQDALIITANNPASPSLSDLRDSRFGNGLKEYFKLKHNLKVFDIGSSVSPYLKTLKEARAFDYDKGSVAALKLMITSNKFHLSPEGDGQVYVQNAGIIIRKDTGAAVSNAPDHLMRLFAYNNVQRKYGTGMITGGILENEVIKEAAEANIVSPASSLVVLETREDYDKFDIQQSKNSLGNASIHSTGAVPEPHEWALIIIVVIMLVCARYKPWQTFKQ